MENSKQIFEVALNLSKPWYVKDIKFTPAGKTFGQLDIYLDFTKGAKFKDETGVECPVHDTMERTWQHLSFFQHTCYLHVRMPRIKTTSGKVQMVEASWARPHSGFTLLFEAFVMMLIESEMPINKVAGILNVYAARIWTIFNYWIALAKKEDKITDIKKTGIDETSAKKGHSYVTLTVDLDKRRVIFACPGKDETTIENLCNHLKEKEIEPKQVSHFSIDMSPAYIQGIMHNFPDSHIVYDRYHLKKLLNEALDSLRKAERSEHDELKGHKYTFLKKQQDLTEKERLEKFNLIELFPKLGEGVRFVEIFDDFYGFNDREKAEAFLAWWCDYVEEARIHPFMKFINTLKGHWSGVINYMEARISNGILEGINSKIQLAKRRARGYRNIYNLINMIYFIAGKLEFNYPHFSI